MDTTLNDPTPMPEILKPPATGSAAPNSAQPMLFQKDSVLRILRAKIYSLSTVCHDKDDLLQEARSSLSQSQDEHPGYTESWHVECCLDYVSD